MFTVSVFIVFFAFVIFSLTYVYMYRGTERYVNLTEYMRKGWPIFAPINCFLYLFTKARARNSIVDLKNYKELDEIRANWETIRDEGMKLYEMGYFDRTNNPDSAAYYDVGFRTFYKYGWSKFYLTWYGHTHKSAKELCPKTVAILKRIPSVNGAMFSILPPGSKLTRHLDPVACSLRYHLGLSTPNSDDCYINVDGANYSWRDGEAFMFDETYLHYVYNNSDKHRLILMCDINRPMFLIGGVVNFFYRNFMRLSLVPNVEGDKQGFANIVFSSVAPILQRSKKLKQTNRPLYLLVKYTTNSIIILLLAVGVWYLIKLLYLIWGWLV